MAGYSPAAGRLFIFSLFSVSMLNPYDLPHDCEREAVALALSGLNRRQRRVLRAYVREVECGEKDLSKWIAEGPDSPSMATWRVPARKGGKYWGTEDDPVKPFREAVRLYRDAWLFWETAEEQKALRKAGRDLRLLAPKAVERLGNLMDYADKDAVRLRAALGVLDRASMETAAKNETVEMSLEEWRAAQARRQAQAAQALTDFGDEDDDPE